MGTRNSLKCFKEQVSGINDDFEDSWELTVHKEAIKKLSGK